MQLRKAPHVELKNVSTTYHYESILEEVSESLNTTIRRQRCLFHMEKDHAHKIAVAKMEDHLDMAKRMIRYMFFQFVSSRYEKKSTIYKSNKSFSEWGEVLGDQVMAAAVLDRILHHCTVVNIKGESYRIKDRKRNSLPTMKKEGEK